MATDKKQVEIPGRLHSVAIEGVVAGANEILDDNKGKNQQEINASMDDSLQENKTNIANEITRATNAENAIKGGSSKSIQNLDSRLSTVEAHDTISMDGGSVVVGTAEDFMNRTTAGDAKIPTVGAILNAADDEPTAGSERLVTSGGVQKELALGAVYDVSAKNPTAGPNNDGKFTLDYILDQNNVNTLIPTAVRKGGMSIKFVQSSDNKYVQYRLMSDTFNTTESDWQGVDDEPTAGSDNLVKSGGVAKSYIIHNIYNKDDVNCVNNKYVSYLTGNLNDVENRKASGWIPVIGGRYYISSSNQQCAWYDSSKTFISGEAQGLVTAKQAPSNAAYLRCTFPMNTEDTNRVNEGLQLFPYSAYNTARTLRLDVLPLSHNINDDNDNPITSAAVKEFADEELSKDFEDVVNSGKTVLRPLNDSTDITNTSNGYYNTAGEFKSSTSFKYQKVTIDHTKAYHIYNNVGSGYSISTLVFFDENDNVLFANGASIALDSIIIFPSYIKSFGTCGINSVVNTITIISGDIANKVGTNQLTDNIFPINENETVFFEATRNTFLPESSQDGVITDAGFYPSYTDFITYFNIPVSPNKNYALSINGEIKSSTRVKSLDASGNYIANSYVSGLSGLYTTPANAAYIVCCFRKADTMQIQLEENEVTPYVYPYAIKKEYLPEIQVLSDGVDISLPDKIYAVVGDTIQLFYNGMIKAVDPFVFNIITNCSKGAMYPRYWQYTPNIGDIGTTNFTLKVLDNNRNVIAEKTTSLVTVAAPVSPSTDIHVLAFGDSLTAGGYWPHECDRRLTGNGGTPAGKELTNITFCGSKVKDGTHFFGAGGWSWTNYTHAGTLAFRFVISGSPQLGMNAVYSNNGHQYKIVEIIDNTILGEAVSDGTPPIPANWEHYQPQASGTLTKVSGSGDSSLTFTSNSVDSANPLWDSVNNKMSFIPYANEFCDGQIDVVYIMMTWNGLSPVNWKNDYSNFITEMNTFANTLHAEFPNAKLKLMAVQFPSVKRAMPVYGASGENHSDVYGALVSIFNMNKAYQDWCNDVSRVSWCEFVNVASQFDSDYCMDIFEKDVNTRVNAIKEYVVDNGVHPKIPEGYYQIADVVYRNFVANFCQNI